MPETVPSFYKTAPVGEYPRYDGEAFSNFLLRSGEVKRIIKPTDSKSRTKKFLEYDVLVEHRENGTATSKIYRNCLNFNSFCGLADKHIMTLRIDDTEKTSANPITANGFGSKVILLCLNGEHSQALILGGIRHDGDSDIGLEGVTDIRVFNGTAIKIKNDGSYSIQVDGATKADGTARDDRVDGGGSSVQVAANGDITISTADNAQAIVVSNSDRTISVAADQDLVVDGTQIHIGKGATEPGVLGNQLANLLTQVLTLCASIASGLPSPGQGASLTAQAMSLTAQVSTVLSTSVTVKN